MSDKNMPASDLYEKIGEIAKRRGFFWPAFELYGGVGGFFTFGNLGTKLMRNIEKKWRDLFIEKQGFLEITDPLITPMKVFEASGHLTHFKENLVECTTCGRRFRSDELIEEQTGEECPEDLSNEELKMILADKGVECPECGGSFGEPIEFMTMFQTLIGATGKDIGYGRPETAQGMFLNFRQGYDLARERLPFALSQIGKCLRNEISPRKGMLRLREFTIMELELFFDPENPECKALPSVADDTLRLLTEDMQLSEVKEPLEMKIEDALKQGIIKTPWQAYFMALSKRFISELGVPADKQRFKALLPGERAHYSAQTYDHEVLLQRWGWVEVSGHAYRTNYDLDAHSRKSGVDMSVLTKSGKRIIPHVVEPSFGLERQTYVTMEYAYKMTNQRTILSLPRDLAPMQLIVLPLVSRDGLPEKSFETYRLLLDEGFSLDLDEKGSIGRRYARADEAGIPLGLTVDYQTLDDNTVTLRDRDSWKQVRQRVEELPDLLRRYFKYRIDFADLGQELKKKDR